MYTKLSLHLWSKDNLVMVGDLLDVFLNSMCKYFVENFFLSVCNFIIGISDFRFLVIVSLFAFGIRVLIA